MTTDLAESTKPWRLPGADQSDYFNYGFDEFTWEMYRQRQANMSAALNQQKEETAQFQQMFGMSLPTAASNPTAPAPPTGPSGGGGGAGAGAAGMGGMENMMTPDQMTMMMAQMQALGMDPSQMDFNAFMQMAGGMGGFSGAPGSGAGGAGYGGGGGGGQAANQAGRGAGGRRGGRW